MIGRGCFLFWGLRSYVWRPAGQPRKTRGKVVHGALQHCSLVLKPDPTFDSRADSQDPPRAPSVIRCTNLDRPRTRLIQRGLTTHPAYSSVEQHRQYGMHGRMSASECRTKHAQDSDMRFQSHELCLYPKTDPRRTSHSSIPD